MQVFVQAAASGAGWPISEVFPGIESQLPPTVGAASEARNSVAETVTGACLEAEVSWPAKARSELPRAASTTSTKTMAHLFMGSPPFRMLLQYPPAKGESTQQNSLKIAVHNRDYP